ncbi:hypothetical protein TNCV_1186111 [Trichonephila clavipes]|nr:hypothetical protein TNCV_1186111 [Trichonephila clavipes]
MLFKSLGLKALWVVAAETTIAGAREHPPVPCLNCGVRDQWCHHLLLRSPTCLTGSGNIHSFLLLGNFTELNRTVICMVLKAKANDSRTSSPLPG